MKRNIICPKCAAEIMARPNWENPYEREHRKIVKGIALADFLCDNCGCETELPKGSVIFAESIWVDYDGVPYFPWESEYLTDIIRPNRCTKL